jgi:hypothetical protein
MMSCGSYGLIRRDGIFDGSVAILEKSSEKPGIKGCCSTTGGFGACRSGRLRMKPLSLKKLFDNSQVDK